MKLCIIRAPLPVWVLLLSSPKVRPTNWCYICNTDFFQLGLCKTSSSRSTYCRRTRSRRWSTLYSAVVNDVNQMVEQVTKTRTLCSKANRGRCGMYTPRPSSVYTTNSLPLTSTPLCLCFTGDICEIHICTVTWTGQKSDSIFIWRLYAHYCFSLLRPNWRLLAIHA